MFLAGKGQKEVEEVLLKIRRNSSEIQTEITEMNTVAQQTKNDSGLKLFFSNNNFRRVVGLGVLLQVMQQFTGINMIFYYASKIFGMAGFESTTSQGWVTVFIGVVNIIACLAAIPFVDRKGRKPLLYYGYVGMTISMLLLSIVFYIGVTSLFIEILAIIAILGFLITFAFSSGPVIWVLCAEIFPLHGRDFGLCVATCANWISNFILALFFLSMLNAIGASNTFLVFTIFNFICLFFIYFLLPETKGVSLESIEEKLSSGASLRNIGE